MTPLDALLLVAFLGFAVRGFMLGFCRSFLRLLGQVLGFFGAVAWHDGVGNWLAAQHYVAVPQAQSLAGIAIFIAISLPFVLLGRVADGFVRAMLLGGVNRIIGAAFGLFRAAVILALALFSAQSFGRQLDQVAPVTDVIATSKIGGPLARTAEKVLRIFNITLPSMQDVLPIDPKKGLPEGIHGWPNP